MIIRFEAGLTDEERSSALEKAGSDYVIEPRCCNVCGEQNATVAPSDFGKNDNNAPVSVIELTKFQCRLCGVYYNMCDECINDQYDHPSKTKCPWMYGCQDDNAAQYVFVKRRKNLIRYDAFGTQVCREYTEAETNIDEISAAMARGMADVLCTYHFPTEAAFLFYVYYVGDRNVTQMLDEARYLRGLVLARVIRPALRNNDIMDNVLRPFIQVETTERDWARFGILDHRNISDLWSYHITNIDSWQPELSKPYAEPKRRIYELSSWSEYQYYNNSLKQVFINFIRLDQSGTEDGKPLLLSFCWANGDEFHIRRRQETNDFEEVFIPFSIVTDDMWDDLPFCRFSRKPRFIHISQVRNKLYFKSENAVMCFVSRVQNVTE